MSDVFMENSVLIQHNIQYDSTNIINQCPICIEAEANCYTKCSHQICYLCAQKLLLRNVKSLPCWICRTPIDAIFKDGNPITIDMNLIDDLSDKNRKNNDENNDEINDEINEEFDYVDELEIYEFSGLKNFFNMHDRRNIIYHIFIAFLFSIFGVLTAEMIINFISSTDLCNNTNINWINNWNIYRFSNIPYSFIIIRRKKSNL